MIQRNNVNSFMSKSVSHGGLVFVCGQVADDLEASLESQTKQALDNLRKELEAAGTSVENLLQTTVYLSEIRTFDAMNDAWQDWFEGANMPTRATVETRLANPNMKIEIVGVAAA